MPYDFVIAKKLFYIFIKATPERFRLLFISVYLKKRKIEGAKKLQKKKNVFANAIISPVNPLQ